MSEAAHETVMSRNQTKPVAVEALAPAPSQARLGSYTAFWVFVFGLMIATPFYAQPPQFKLPVELLVSIAIFSTGLFAIWSVLYPFVLPGKGLKRFGGYIVTLIFIIVVFGLAFCVVDIARALYGPASGAVAESGAAWARIWRFAMTFHSSIYVALFFAVDWLIYMGAASEQDRDQFRKIALYIDLPMLFGITYTAYVAAKFPENFGPLFGAGAIALQLVVANIQLLLFERANYFWPQTRIGGAAAV